jgi:hypothetical protein
MNELLLRRAILGAVAAALPISASLVACGGTSSPTDGGGDDASNNDVWCPCCGLPPPQEYTVTYDVCSVYPPDAGLDASADANADADAAATVCYSSCYQACQANVPTNNTGGGGECLGDIDGGDGGVRVAQCQVVHFCGRRLDGLAEPAEPQKRDMIAHAAWLEAASIHAFRRLARELDAHGAPDTLVRRARACARDEARHARLMARIARRHGARIPPVDVRPSHVRDIESVARENAVEGCVGETFGALFAAWYARRASDPELRTAMASIAPDELRHAALGWDVAAWAETKLDASARARVRQARHDAVAAIIEETRHDPEPQRLVAAMVNAGVWSGPIE